MEHIATSTLTREDVSVRADESLSLTPAPDQSSERLPVAPDKRKLSARRIIGEGRIVFLLAFGSYLAVAILLDFKYKVFPADAFSRMANGFYIIYSSDPHLAAVGFVWEPLQSFADLVVLLGNHLWPALSRDEMAGSLVSALAMAGAAYQILCALREWGVSRAPRLVLTAFFALDPMVVYYGGNGMSEGLYLFTLITSTRYLLRWMRDGDLRSLAYSATALAFCYLTRNEAAAAALFGGLAVGVVSYSRVKGSRKLRFTTGMSDLVVFGVPAFIAAAGWAICSYVIIGAFIDGGALSVRLANQQGHGGTLMHRVFYETDAILALAPFLPILLVIGAIVTLRRRDPRILAPVALLGGSLGFDTFSYLSNSIDAALRYWIAVVPLGVLLLGAVIAAIQTPRPARGVVPVPTRSKVTRVRGPGALFACCLVLLVMIPTLVYTGSSLVNPNIGLEESAQIGFIFKPHDKALAPRYVYPFVQALDRWLVGLHLPDNDVLVDNADGTGCVAQMIVRSSQPKVFLIPNDRDFQRVLADPIAFHTRYLLVPDPQTLGPGVINTTYPTLWKTGAGFSKLVHQFQGGKSACPDYRLFRVIGHTNEVS